MDQELPDLPDQTPPREFEPQVGPTPKDPGVYENPGDLISDADDVEDADASKESGDADDNDDNAEDPN